MYRRTPFLIYTAVFILTWPAHFTARGIPKTRNEQCLKRGYLAACTYSANRKPCQVLKCGYLQRATFAFHELILINGVPDFTECGESKICMNGECVDANGPMPDYRSEVDYVNCHQVYRQECEHVPTRREQCKNYGFDVACEADDGPASLECHALKCGYEGRNGFYYWRSPEKLPIPLEPATGTWCGPSQACRRKQCISLSNWPMYNRLPTYSHPEVFDICCPEIEN